MLKDANISLALWAEAIHTTLYLLNQAPTKVLENITLEEAWIGNNSFISYFKVFGCTTYMHVHKVQRINMDGKSLKCIFLGYSSESKGYSLMDALTKKVYISTHIFDEETICNISSSPYPTSSQTSKIIEQVARRI